jgi:hypothetical protein
VPLGASVNRKRLRGQPAYRAFTARKAKQEGKKVSWISIGAAWPHRDQKGIDVVLDAFRIDERVILRATDQGDDRPYKREEETITSSAAAISFLKQARVSDSTTDARSRSGSCGFE